MPILKLPYRGFSLPTMPLSISGHGITGIKKRVRARFALNTIDNYLDVGVIKALGLFPYGHTTLTSGRETEFYFVDLHLTVGLMGSVPDRYVFRGVAVIPSRKLTGLVIGMDLIRRGRLTVDGDGVTFCI
jgi:hypothetical protein